MAIKCKQVGKYFKNQNLQVLRDINIEAESGEFICILGPSGCGKTTLLRIIAGIEQADEGEVILPSITDKHHVQTAMVFQDNNVFPWMNVMDNILFGMQNTGLSLNEQVKQAKGLVNLVKLSGFENMYANRLSGGMQQRVGIARAFAANAEVLLMDEPFSALDAQTRLTMQEELLGIWWQHRKTVVYITHDIDEALLLGDRIYILTRRPATVKEVINVDLDRPRGLHDIDKPEIRELRWKIWKSLAEPQT